MKHKIDALDTANFMCKYTLIEGDVLGDKLESVVYEVKFVSQVQVQVVYARWQATIIQRVTLTLRRRKLQLAKTKAIGMYKVVEEYLFANPDAYA